MRLSYLYALQGYWHSCCLWKRTIKSLKLDGIDGSCFGLSNFKICKEILQKKYFFKRTIYLSKGKCVKFDAYHCSEIVHLWRFTEIRTNREQRILIFMKNNCHLVEIIWTNFVILWDRQERPSLCFIMYSSLVDIKQTLCHWYVWGDLRSMVIIINISVLFHKDVAQQW